MEKAILSDSEPFIIGHGSEDALISEGERESHFHILGSTREGKSKFLEYLIRHDIDRLQSGEGVGLCFIDPSDQGDTIRKILAYCAEINFKKVFLVDPYRLWMNKKVAPINPFNYNHSQIGASISHMKDSLRVLFGVKDAGDTSNIERFGFHLFNVLHRAKMTLNDLTWWTSRNDFGYLVKREFIYDRLARDPRAERSIIALNDAFSTTQTFERFQSTIGRASAIAESESLSYIFGHRNGVDFRKLIEHGYVVLVNVSDLDVLPSRFLATVVINQVLQGMDRLRRNGYGKPYYLYIDEAGEYATRKLARVLELKGKAGIRVILAHQHPGQFEDQRIRDTVETQAKMKAAFYTEPKYRAEIVKLLDYGGQIKDRDVIYALSSQKKQHMVLRLGKDSPRVVKVPDTPDAKGDVEGFVKELFKSQNYYTAQEIEQDYADRFSGLKSRSSSSKSTTKGTRAKTPRKGKVDDSPSTRDFKKPPNTIFDK